MSTTPAQPSSKDATPPRDLPALPPGWCWTTLATIASIEGGITKDQKRLRTDSTREVPYLRVANVQRGYLDLRQVKSILADEEEIKALRLQKGDILFTEGGDRDKLGRGWVWNNEVEECIHQNHIFRARLRSPEIEPKFVSLHGNFFGQQWFTTTGKQTTNLASINKGVLSRFPVPLAPPNEQRRIVAKVEEMFSEADAGVAALRRVQANVRRYRSAVLQAAVEGRLTETWRDEHRPSETGTQLLARILSDRRRRWEDEQRAAFAAAKKDPPKNWQAKYKEPATPDTANLSKLPEGWCWATVEQVGEVQLGRQRSPQHHTGEHMRPYLRVANVFEDRIDLTDVLEMNFTPKEFVTYELKHGDILLNEGQSLELVGRPAMYRGELPGSCFQNTLVRFRVCSGVLPEFALIVYRACLHNRRFQKIAKWTVNIAHLGAERVALVEFPLPSEDEQQEIVAAVGQAFASLKAVEAEVVRGLARAAQLRQSVLRQAFDGKLVAQDPADEPASALLARIQQEQAKIQPTTAASKKPRKLANEVFMRRASVVSYTVRRLAAQRSFGRTQLEKTVHLTQTHLGVDLGFVFERYAAGPFDKDIYKLEGVARKKDWFTTQKRSNFGVTYHPGSKIDQMCNYATGYLGDRQAALDRLLDHIAEMNMDEAELFATAYAAWNDLLIDGRPADDEAVIAEVHGWHEQKKKFSPEVIKDRLNWMRQNGYIPTGQGQRTRLAAKATRLHSRRRKKGDAST